MARNEDTTHIRIDRDTLDKVRELVPRVQARHPELRVTTADVMRMVLRRGIDTLVIDVLTDGTGQ